MNPSEAKPTLEVPENLVRVLLVDDQLLICEAVRRLLVGEKDISYQFCNKPEQAIATANQVKPTVILQDLVMPGIDGLSLVSAYRENDETKDIPLIVLSTKEDPVTKAEAFARGANDYVVKLPDKLELIARIRYHSKGYVASLQRNAAYQALAASEHRLAHEIAAAERYVRSLMPDKIKKPISIDWRFEPSAELGGDLFGYHWLDEEKIAFYLLDVTGHGLGSALLSVTAMNVLRSRALPNTDFADPAQVLRGLNSVFQMDQQDGKFFTIFYGVYEPAKRSLRWAGAGHPPSLLFEASNSEPIALNSQNPMIGMLDDFEAEAAETTIVEGARLFVFSDGAFEVHQKNGKVWTFGEFIDFLKQAVPRPASVIDELMVKIRELHGEGPLDDDFSMLELKF